MPAFYFSANPLTAWLFPTLIPSMLSLFLMVLVFQGARVGPRSSTASTPLNGCVAAGAAEHFQDGVDVIGKLIWPSDMIPKMIDVELEDEDGTPIDSVKSQPNNQFYFRRIKILNPVTCAFKNYNIIINATEGLDNVRQQLSLNSNNFTGAQISIQVKPI